MCYTRLSSKERRYIFLVTEILPVVPVVLGKIRGFVLFQNSTYIQLSGPLTVLRIPALSEPLSLANLDKPLAVMTCVMLYVGGPGEGHKWTSLSSVLAALLQPTLTFFFG